MKYFKIIVLTLCSIVIIFSCKEDKKQVNVKENTQAVVAQKKLVSIIYPKANERFIFSDKIDINISLSDSSATLDSTILFVNGALSAKVMKFPYQYSFTKVGTQDIKTESWINGKKETNRVNVIVYSDTKPTEISYQIINVFPHDKNAYTQGLVYENKYFFEGTGRFGGRSSLRKVEVKTGKVIHLYTMLPQYFGEGIAVINDKIYQITYKSQKGFVYDKERFKELKSFNFSTNTNEGWGLTYNGTHLIMSDGSYNLYYMDPEYFSEQKRIQVCDNNGFIDNLNELEYINGLIYANIYQTEKIVVIDPETGKVVGKANMKGLLKKQDMHPQIDVLNGIAYDKNTNRIFVTGKNWPKLFEIKFSPNL